MVQFYKDKECIEPLWDLTFEGNSIEDLYGGVLENVVEIGESLTKTIYMKNDSDLSLVIRNAVAESPLISLVVGTGRLNAGDVTPVTVVFESTMEMIKEIEDIEDQEKRKEARRNLLNSNIQVEVYHILY